MRSRLTLTSIVGVTLAVWSCGGSGAGSSSATTPTGPTATIPAPTPTPVPAPTPPSQRTVTVSIIGSIGTNAFTPNPISANLGDAVNFTNNSTTTHHIVLDDGSTDLGQISPGATSQSLTLKSAAPIGFQCVIHPSMIGTINGVTAPAPPPGNGNPY